MFLFSKRPTQPYYIRLRPFTYYGSNRKRLYSLLKKFFKKHKGFAAVKNQVLNKEVPATSNFTVTFSCTDRERLKIDALLKKHDHDGLDRAPLNKGFLIRSGFIKSIDDKNTPYERWIHAESSR